MKARNTSKWLINTTFCCAVCDPCVYADTTNALRPTFLTIPSIVSWTPGGMLHSVYSPLPTPPKGNCLGTNGKSWNFIWVNLISVEAAEEIGIFNREMVLIHFCMWHKLIVSAVLCPAYIMLVGSVLRLFLCVDGWHLKRQLHSFTLRLSCYIFHFMIT